jgi:arsenite-transporting ATPase
MTTVPVPDGDVFDALKRFYERIDAVRAALADPAQTSVRLVVNPERMVIAEARRTYTYLSLFGYRVDAVVVNRLLPDDVADPWFDAWKTTHAAHLAEIEEAFAPLPVLKARLAAQELAGVAALRELGRELFGDADPSVALHEGSVLEVTQREGAWVLALELPFAERDDVALSRKGDELFVTIGGQRRAILLPDSLRRRRVTDAVVQGGRLEVVFGEAT